MKTNMLEKANRLAGFACAAEMAISHGNVRAMVTARQMLILLDRQIMLVLSAISLREAKFNLPKPGHSVYEREQKDNPYRCWACAYFGTEAVCDNLWLDRPACMLFVFNRTLDKNRDRLKNITKGKRKLQRIKLPKIKTYSEHIATCKFCERIWNNPKIIDKGERTARSVKHYRQYKKRRRKKRMVVLAYYGINYREDYIQGWEE
jgi:hypothetical protein